MSGASSTEDPTAIFRDDSFWSANSGGETLDLSGIIQTLSSADVMGNLELLFRESYKFIRLADDLHEIRSYLNDIRICFIALTVSGYIGILIYALIMLCKRSRPTRQRQAWGDGELQSVRTEAPGNRNTGFNHRRHQPRLDIVDGDLKTSLVSSCSHSNNTSVPALAKDTLGDDL